MNLRWYTVNEEFLDYLRNDESRIPCTDYGLNKFKPFFGVLFEIGDLVYITQVTHPKERHYRMKNNKDFIKLYYTNKNSNRNEFIAVVNLNYMFPVLKNKLTNVEYGNIDSFRNFKNENEKGKYITLLKREMNAIHKNNIPQKAIDLYRFKYKFPENIISKRCFDFKGLEALCHNYE